MYDGASGWFWIHNSFVYSVWSASFYSVNPSIRDCYGFCQFYKKLLIWRAINGNLMLIYDVDVIDSIE